MKLRISMVISALVVMVLSGCSLDIANPNQPSDLEVLSTREGIIALAVGMQQNFATIGMESILTVPGTSSRELTPDFDQVPLRELDEGGTAMPNTSQLVNDYWTRMYKIIAMCDQLITSIPAALPAGGTRSGALALAYTYKAMCLGNLAQNWEQAALSSGSRTSPATFVARAQVFAEALRLLTEANALISATPVSTDFTNNVQVKGFNLQNTIRLLLARYSLFSGKNQEAITFANAVDITAAGRSEFRYDNSANVNPIFNITVTAIRWTPRRYFGFDGSSGLVDTTDKRLGFFTVNRDKPSVLKNLPVATFTATSPFGGIATSIPAFRPGEVALIKAEANARLNNLDQAITDLNVVRTKKASADYLGIGADLPAYAGAKTQADILTEVYKQRCAELYVSGLKLEDARRFNRPAPVTGGGSQTVSQLLRIERTRNFYLFPQTERDNNPNVPADPAN